MSRATRGQYELVARWLARWALLAGLWCVLTHGDPWSWLVGAPASAVLAWWSLPAAGAWSPWLRASGVARFIPFFLWRSLIGSCDVAWRALDWRLPIRPVLRTYPLRLAREGPARVVLSDAINLLPGTLTVALEDDCVRLHVLTDGPEILRAVERLEEHVAALFGQTLEPREDDDA